MQSGLELEPSIVDALAGFSKGSPDQIGMSDHAWGLDEMCATLPAAAAKRIDTGLILKHWENGPASMFGVFFSILVVVALLSICGEIAMRVRLTKRASHDKIAWWRRGGDEVHAIYEEVFPGSCLPFFTRFVFWLLITCAGVLVISTLLLKSN